MKNSTTTQNFLLMAGVILLATIPLISQRQAEFSGTDTQAEDVIATLDPNYEPWTNPLLTPASGEIESLLFAVQAGIGTGIIGYVIGWYRGQQGNKT